MDDPSIDFRVDVLKSRRGATVTLGEAKVTLDANTITLIIHHLASARMEMIPPIPDRMPEGEATSVRVRNLEIRHFDETGAVALVLGHPGIGWVAYHLAPSDAQTLLTTLSSILASPSPRKPPARKH